MILDGLVLGGWAGLFKRSFCYFWRHFWVILEWKQFDVNNLNESDFFVACFPKTLPRAAMRNRDRLEKLKLNGDINDELLEPPQENSLKDLLNTLKRLFTNKVLVCNNIASIFYVFGYIPYFKYQAKYIEVQYLFSSSTANMITGSVSLVFTAIGFLIAGVVIQVYKPKARYLAGWNVIASALSIIGLLGFAMYGCDANNNVEIVKL